MRLKTCTTLMRVPDGNASFATLIQKLEKVTHRKSMGNQWIYGLYSFKKKMTCIREGANQWQIRIYLTFLLVQLLVHRWTRVSTRVRKTAPNLGVKPKNRSKDRQKTKINLRFCWLGGNLWNWFLMTRQWLCHCLGFVGIDFRSFDDEKNKYNPSQKRNRKTDGKRVANRKTAFVFTHTLLVQ